jgi:hypothetical protein
VLVFSITISLTRLPSPSQIPSEIPSNEILLMNIIIITTIPRPNSSIGF